MTTHAFDSTGEAYDACQCDDGIKDGDVLDVAAEGVVGLASTWPVAVTAEKGELHAIDAAPGALDRVSADAKWSEQQIREAVSLAAERGYEIAEAFRGFVPAALSM